MTQNHLTSTQPVDFDLHGCVGIRLINASAADTAAVSRQLGPIRSSLSRQPDIVIEFVQQLPLPAMASGPLRYIGVDDTAFTDDAFFVLRSKHKSRAMVQIPFAEIGQQCHIRCETGLTAVPLLIPILNLTALHRGLLPLHASAFEYQGMGVLTTGWSKGGKTETLLSFMAQGATYIGDEWIYITEDGGRIFGIPEPIRIWEWHLQSMPEYRRVLKGSDRTRLRALKNGALLSERLGDNRMVQKSALGKLLKRISPFLKQQLHADVPPRRLFGERRESSTAGFDKVVFVASHATPEITVERMDPMEIARRMLFSLQEERQNFISYYHKFRFAFPEVCNPAIEEAKDVEQKLLMRVLGDKDAYALYHPYPVELPALFNALEPVLRSDHQVVTE